MRIAILGSTALPVPPLAQGGAEWIAYHQAKGLAERGHEILLFAPEESEVPGVTLIKVGVGKTASGVGREKGKGEEKIYGASYKLRLEISNLAQVIEELVKRRNDYDLILNNIRGEAVLLPVVYHFIKKPFCHVLHLPIFSQLAESFQKFKTPIISLSFAQRREFPRLNYLANVPNCVDIKKFAYSPSAQDYLLYLGSMGRNKNPKDAILAAKKAGEKLILGGRIKDMAYFKDDLEPLVDGRQIKWVGEVTREEVIKLYQGAKAFLFPTLWQEPFGLVMIEALSCGTPVIAYPNGAVPEVIVDGKTGFLVKNVSLMARAIKKIDQIKRENCRKYVEANFTVEKMVEGYEKALMRLIVKG